MALGTLNVKLSHKNKEIEHEVPLALYVTE